MKFAILFKYLLLCVAILGALGAVAALLGFAYYRLHPVFGGQPDEASLARIRASKAYDGAQFTNLEPTPLFTGDEQPSVFMALLKFVKPTPHKNPAQPLPTVPLNLSQLKNGSIAWLGHSSVLFQMGDLVFLTDPVFHNASPLPLTGRPFAMTHAPAVAGLPAIDAVLISHDHYDHLDYRAIQEIDSRTKRFFVPLGVKAHLQRWGVASRKITELDWHEQVHLGQTAIIFVPARHFSGRTLRRNTTLWGGYVIKSPGMSLYFSADSGYGKHFLDIISKYAPFDFVMIENGAYNSKWALIHETPEQAAQAARDVKAMKVMPIHWGKFDLSDHPWKEPIERFLRAAQLHSLDVATPRIGQVFQMGQPLPKEKWRESVQ